MFRKRCQNIAVESANEMFGVKCAFLFDFLSRPNENLLRIIIQTLFQINWNDFKNKESN